MTRPDSPDDQRARMVRADIAGRGVTDPAVLRAMGTVPRDAFVPPVQARFAYDDCPLPIGEGQTISQPYIVALMAEAAELGPGDRVLEVGTGSGYGAAVLSRIATQVVTIERHEVLAERARAALADLGYDNVAVVVGDGSLGWPDAAPYDAIVVTADAPSVPEALVAQLADGGRLVIPVGRSPGYQTLVRVRRRGDDLVTDDLGAVAFVPLIGEQGFEPR